MGNSAIKQHIQTSEKTGTCQLCKLGLKEFPEELESVYKNLRTLDLSDNKFHILPASIGSFNNLKTLSLNNNKLESFPNEIGNLKKLETLLAENNSIRSLPSSFSGLKHLRTVNLSGNHIKQFPMQLCGLNQLDVVNLSQNRITVIPEDINTFQGIELNLNQNQVSTLPEGITGCPRLKVIRLEENCLELKAFTPKILKESKVALFAIEGNVFDMKAFHNIEGYDEYMERFTATKKKFN